MKKIVYSISVAVFSVVAMFGIKVNTYGDVIYEPENSFYSAHAKECVYVERTYTVNGPDGKVTVYSDPENGTVEGELKNGAEAHVYYTYYDGEYEWGYVTEMQQRGWVPMPYLQEIYDDQAFKEQHSDELKYDGWDLKAEFCDMDINVWLYPGAKEPANYINVPKSENCMGGSPEYSDEFGHNWGYFSYYYGMKGWICTDNPTGSYEELYPNGGPEYQLNNDNKASDAVQEVIEPKNENSGKTLIYIGIMIGAVIVVTVILLVIFGKRKPKSDEEDKDNKDNEEDKDNKDNEGTEENLN